MRTSWRPIICAASWKPTRRSSPRNAGIHRVVAELEHLNRQMAATIARGGPDMVLALQAINSRFHRAILDASASPRLKTLLATIIDMPIVVRSFSVSTRADIQQSLQHHRDLTDAIASGDGDVAAQAMQLHLRIAARRFFRRRAEFVKMQKAAAPDGTPTVPRRN